MISQDPKQPTILLVDDTPKNLKVLNVFLKEAGFRVAVAQSGEDALEHVKRVCPDLILLDVLMPSMDGFETCRRLKEHEDTRDIPVIFLTALTETVDKVKGFEIGGVDYITKPVQHEEVLARITTHLTIRKLHIQLQQEHDRFRSLAEATLEGIVIYDEERILEANYVAVEMFGYSHSELIDKNIPELLTSESWEIIAEHFRTGNEPPCEVEGITKDGAIFPMEMQVRAMSWQERDVKVAAVRDITWRKTMEQERTQLRREVRSFRSTLQDRYKFGKIIGKSPAMQAVYQSIVNASASDANVILYGESGTGKELVARTIHHLSERKAQAFVPVNCGAIPESLFEREFFGHRKGAFTGADRHKEGLFDLAHQGTLFLDEIGELNALLQVKLLRAIDRGEYMPIGSNTLKTVDVRIIAATNKNLKELLQEGDIREDFYYRIRVIVINLPPLRDRREDIPLLIEHFLEQYSTANKRPPIPGRLMDSLCTYHWPGNVRELQNELQRYLVEGHLEFMGNEPVERAGEPEMKMTQTGLSFREAVEAFEKHLIADALAQNAGHQGKTAKMLDISEKTLYNKMRKYGVKSDK